MKRKPAVGSPARGSVESASARMKQEHGKRPPRPDSTLRAQMILARFWETVHKGQSPSRAMNEYLADAFGRVLLGESADVALGLRRGRAGRPLKSDIMLISSANDRRDFELARAVHRVHVERHCLLTASYAKIARARHVSVMMVRRAWKRYGPWIEQRLQALAAESALDGTPPAEPQTPQAETGPQGSKPPGKTKRAR